MEGYEAPRSRAARYQSGIPPKPTPHFAKVSLGVPLAPSSSKQASRFSAKGNKKLSTYILATVICDLNVEFISSNIDYRSRTRDQMEQAGRSGKQNIAEGYTMQSLESYIKLLGVAVGSIKELAADYEDFLRQRKLSTWSKNDPRIRVFWAFRAV